MRPFLRRLGVTFGALDIFAAPLLKPAPRQLLHALGLDKRPLQDRMLPVLGEIKGLPAGYRHAGGQIIRVDLAEKILRAAFDGRAAAANKPDADAPAAAAGKRRNSRAGPRFRLNLALAVSIGLEEANARLLLGSAGFRFDPARVLAEGASGPPAPDMWSWRPRRPGENAGQNNKDQRSARRNHSRKTANQSENGGGKDGMRKPNDDSRRKRQHNDERPQPKPDTGPARAGGAFDKLADLLGR
jgi:ATP-dependent RNA helicase SUPV3L1/SUV3